MYEAHAKRVAVERVHRLRDAMVSGAWANSNYDDEHNTREKLLKGIDAFAQEAVASIYGAKEQEEQIDTSHPFWAAAKVPSVQMKRNQAQDD